MARKRQNRRVERRPAAVNDPHDNGLPASVGLRQATDIDERIQRHVIEHLETQLIEHLETQLPEIVAIKAESFLGPLPHPDHLAGYESVISGAADRIIRMTEQQVEHRQRIEAHVVESTIKFESRGQWLAFSLATMIIAGGIYLILEDKTIVGLASMISAIVALASVFIYTKRLERSGDAAQRAARPAQPEPPRSPPPPD